MAIYTYITDYISCDTDTKAKIARIDAIITALEDQELIAASNSDIEEYRLDDGQTIIKTIFRDPVIIEKTIHALTRRKKRLQNECVGYRYGLIDGNAKI